MSLITNLRGYQEPPKFFYSYSTFRYQHFLHPILCKKKLMLININH